MQTTYVDKIDLRSNIKKSSIIATNIMMIDLSDMFLLSWGSSLQNFRDLEKEKNANSCQICSGLGED